MLLASYYGVRDGWMAAGTVALRLRLHGSTDPCPTHTEVFFEESDGPEVAALMPDGSLAPDESGHVWGYSNVGLERMPAHSPVRAGELGGARFKRMSTAKFRLTPILNRDPLTVARRAHRRQGRVKYDWWLIWSFLHWFIPQSKERTDCNEEVLTVLGFPQAYRLDPISTESAVQWANGLDEEPT